MTTFNFTIKDPVGIHARPAGLLVKLVGTLTSTVMIKKGDKSADAKRLFAIMGLGIKCGEEIIVRVEGDNEVADAKALEDFLNENL